MIPRWQLWAALRAAHRRQPDRPRTPTPHTAKTARTAPHRCVSGTRTHHRLSQPPTRPTRTTPNSANSTNRGRVSSVDDPRTSIRRCTPGRRRTRGDADVGLAAVDCVNAVLCSFLALHHGRHALRARAFAAYPPSLRSLRYSTIPCTPGSKGGPCSAIRNEHKQ